MSHNNSDSIITTETPPQKVVTGVVGIADAGASGGPPPVSIPSFSVHGRCFIVTGGTQGLGLAIARVLVEQGAAGIALVSRNIQKGKDVCVELSALSNSSKCRCVHVCVDVSIANDASSIVPKAVEMLKDIGPISGIVNAAATTARGNLLTETATGFDYQMAVNVRAPFLITQAAAKHMIEHKITNGSIVNISSCAAYGGAPFIMSYTTSKAALSTMTRTHAHELAPYRIRVNAVNMGWCYTDNEDSVQKVNNLNWLHDADKACPMGRILRPVDVAVTVNYLLSDASIMMTASVLELHPEFPNGMISLAPDEANANRS